MGLPALDMRHHEAAATRPVRTPTTTRTAKSGVARSSAREAEHCRHAFNLACIVMLGLAFFGIGRVMLCARAAETAIEAGRLQKDIKAERLAGDLLEVDKSALATPSRIESIAQTTLKMGQAAQVSYLSLPAQSMTSDAEGRGASARVPVAETVSQRGPANGDGASTSLAGMLDSVMRMAAGEAQVLLVGDAGLATAK